MKELVKTRNGAYGQAWLAVCDCGFRESFLTILDATDAEIEQKARSIGWIIKNGGDEITCPRCRGIGP